MTSYVNAKIWDGATEACREGSLFVNGSELADRSSDNEVVDLSNHFVIPGLIDVHVHLCLNPEIRDPSDQTKAPKDERLDDIRTRAKQMLLAGITTARDLGGGEHLELQIRDEVAQGKIPGPRILCSGQPITSPSGHCHFWGGEAADVEEALEVLQRQHQEGVDLIKVMATGGNITPGSKPIDSQFDQQTVEQIVLAARQHDYHVAAHCHGTEGIGFAAAAGVRTIEHCSWVGEAGWGRDYDSDAVANMVKNDVFVSPTINSGWRRFKQEEFVKMVQANYAQMKAAGVKLVASTDAGIPNIFHDDLPKALPEFARFAELSPTEVLRAATIDAAQAIGLGGIAGRLEPGYAADFVVYAENPLEDLSILESPVLVVASGVAYRVS